jgi:hypothetical protein
MDEAVDRAEGVDGVSEGLRAELASVVGEDALETPAPDRSPEAKPADREETRLRHGATRVPHVQGGVSGWLAAGSRHGASASQLFPNPILHTWFPNDAMGSPGG